MKHLIWFLLFSSLASAESIKIENVDSVIVEKWNETLLQFKALDPGASIYTIQDGIEMEVNLESNPGKNNFDFQIAGYEDLDFFYQPSFANENKDGSTWEENQWGGIRTRPENVNNSYAVYHKWKKDGQYQTGKICHIYRPKAIDAKGNFVWGNLYFDSKTGILTVIIPQDFLNNAVYPVVVDPTIGNNVQGASDDTLNQTTGCNVFTAPGAGDGSAGTVHAFLRAASGTFDWKLGMYSTSGGVPNSQPLLSNTVTVTGTNTTFQDISGAINLPTIVNGTQYCLAVNGGASTDHVAFDGTGSDTIYYFADGHVSALSTYPVTPNTASPEKLSIWIVYSGPASVSATIPATLHNGILRGAVIP